MDLYAATVMALTKLLAAGGGANSAFSVRPDASKAPGSSGLQDVLNGIAFYGLLAATAGFLLGGIIWAVGGRVGNDYTATGGKIGMFTAIGVAFLFGAMTAILQFAYNAGGS